MFALGIMSEMPEALKDRLRKLRISLHLCQKEMASKLDVPVHTYRSWEYGKKNPNRLTMPEINRRIETL
jgi:DNA-binding XRE family transcriptional regulator